MRPIRYSSGPCFVERRNVNGKRLEKAESKAERERRETDKKKFYHSFSGR